MEYYPKLGPACHGVPHRLQRAREAAGYSLRAAATMLGLTHPTVAALEDGRRVATVWDVFKAAEAYGVSPAWVMGITQSFGPGTDESEERRALAYCHAMKAGSATELPPPVNDGQAAAN